jgi:hypothetical protein
MGLIITLTAVLIGLFLVMKNASGFQTAAGQISNVFNNAVSTLMGPH